MMDRRRFIATAAGFLAAPLAVKAQPAGKVFRVGVLFAGNRAATGDPVWGAFELGLRELGLVEGRNLVLEWRTAGGKLERLPALAAEMVTMKVDVIVVPGPAAVPAARAATTTIPIVMIAGSSDPIGEGLIASFARPGGNITGLTYAVSPERFGKQLELLREAMGRLSRVGILWDLDLDHFRRNWAPALERAARELGLQIQGPFQVLKTDDFEPAFAAMIRQRTEAILVGAGSIIFPNRARICELAIRNRIAVMAAFREFTQAGGLISYGPNFPVVYRRAAFYVDRILKGANPAELPVEQPTKYDLVLNLKTASVLGLTIPPTLLATADETIQ